MTWVNPSWSCVNLWRTAKFHHDAIVLQYRVGQRKATVFAWVWIQYSEQFDIQGRELNNLSEEYCKL